MEEREIFIMMMIMIMKMIGIMMTMMMIIMIMITTSCITDKKIMNNIKSSSKVNLILSVINLQEEETTTISGLVRKRKRC